jgi:hypothetical protein
MLTNVFLGGEFSHFLDLKNMISKDIQRIFVKKIGPKFARFLQQFSSK